MIDKNKNKSLRTINSLETTQILYLGKKLTSTLPALPQLSPPLHTLPSNSFLYLHPLVVEYAPFNLRAYGTSFLISAETSPPIKSNEPDARHHGSVLSRWCMVDVAHQFFFTQRVQAHIEHSHSGVCLQLETGINSRVPFPLMVNSSQPQPTQPPITPPQIEQSYPTKSHTT